MACDDPGNIKVILIPDFGDNERDFQEYIEKERKLTSEDLECLSDTTRGSRGLLCYGLVNPSSGASVGVIAIDSLYEIDPKLVKKELLDMAGGIIARGITQSSG